nr:LysR substrate-binding domain-containing protein [Aliidiomarina minuta]
MDPAAQQDRAHWHFVEQGSDLHIPVSGRLKVNSSQALVNALRQGVGIGMVPRYQVARDLQAGTMTELLTDFMPPPSPVYLVYPHRRHMNAAVKSTLDFFHQNIENP